MRVRVKRGYPLENCPRVTANGVEAVQALACRIGTVLYPDSDALETMGHSALVEFDDYIGGHNGGLEGRKGKNGHCWWLRSEQLEQIEQSTELRDMMENAIGEYKEAFESAYLDDMEKYRADAYSAIEEVSERVLQVGDRHDLSVLLEDLSIEAEENLRRAGDMDIVAYYTAQEELVAALKERMVVAVELTNAQLGRLNEMYTAVYDTVMVFTEDCLLEWNMSIIGDVTDAIICALRGYHLRVRYPGIVEDADGTQHYEEYGNYAMREDPAMRKVVLCKHCVLRNKMGCPSAELDEGQWRTMSCMEYCSAAMPCMEYCSAAMTNSEAVTRE